MNLLEEKDSEITLAGESETTLAGESVWLDPTLVGELLTGALVAADKSKDAMPRLGSVYITYAGGEIKVSSTDRYRLIIGRAHVGSDGSLSEVRVSVADVKRILTLIKENKNHSHLALNRTGNILEVWIEGNKVIAEVESDTLPNTDNILKRETESIASISLNADYLGSFSKVPSNSKQAQIFLDFTGDKFPVKIKVPHDRIVWDCALMPMRDTRNS